MGNKSSSGNHRSGGSSSRVQSSPALANVPRSVQNSRSSIQRQNPTPTVNGPRTNAVPMQQQRQPARAPTTSQPVRCPRCRRLLQPPQGHDRFLCPCGQMLLSPNSSQAMQQQQPRPQQPPQSRNVRCPACNTMLLPPAGAPIFQCPCGTRLRSPLTNLGTSQARMDPSAPPATSDINKMMEANQSQVVAALMHRRGQEQWLRTLCPDGRSLQWQNLRSDEAERRHLMVEEKCLKELEQNVDKLNTEGLYNKLEALQISTDDCVEKEDLKDKLKHAPELLLRETELELKARLDDLGVDYEEADKEYLMSRLITAAWNRGLYEDGFCREIKKDWSLDWISATRSRLECPGQSAAQLENMSCQPFMTKHKWFQDQCKARKYKWEDGRVQIKVRRSELLQDSFTNLNKLKPEDFLRFWRFEFIGEEGIDAGGLAREWFQGVTQRGFNVDFGLFEYSGVDNICYQINPSSGIANDLHLKYFLFLGRVMAKALFEGHTISAHMARPLYKHILGFPITADDIEFVDPQVHKSMKDIRECDDAEYLYLDFTTAVNVFGETKTVELKPGGADIEVTNDNREEYLNLLVKYILFDRLSPQLAMLLRGFYEVLPPTLLSVFDYAELELLMCGLPNINVDDWLKNTVYRGEYASQKSNHKLVRWFWECMREFTEEQRARFLQFATGTSRVPVQGFGALQGNDGNIKPFCIESVPLKTSVFVKAHTCFNRIELPLYRSKEEMKGRILQGLNFESEGFHSE